MPLNPFEEWGGPDALSVWLMNAPIILTTEAFKI